MYIVITMKTKDNKYLHAAFDTTKEAAAEAAAARNECGYKLYNFTVHAGKNPFN